ncbi:MAG: copper chaperone PCu(A)C [Hyphomicrobium sp.]|nr:copper chaperone PCu(A)C [Hyphomicrobium sp.]
MRRRWRVLLPGLAAVAIAVHAQAHEIKSKSLAIDHPWIRVTPKGSVVTAGYLTVANHGKTADRLLGASLTGAGAAELHETTIEDGVAKMRPLRDGVEIGPGQTVSLEPNGRHIMFLDLKTSFEADTYVDGTLTFEKAGQVPVEFFVEAGSGKPHHPAPAGTGTAPTGSHEHHQH